MQPNAKVVLITFSIPTSALCVTPPVECVLLVPPPIVNKTVVPLLLKDVGEPQPWLVMVLASIPLLKLISLSPIKNSTRLLSLLPLP